MVSKDFIRERLGNTLISMEKQGFDVRAHADALKWLPDSYDALLAFSQTLDQAPTREDWPYKEPLAWEDILAELPDPPPVCPIPQAQAQELPQQQVQPNSFTITFTDGLGNTLKTETVAMGGSVMPPPNPTRNNYNFVGWDKPVSSWSNVTGGAIITALWSSASEPLSEQEPIVVLDSEVIFIPGTTVPLFGTNHWSLFNLLCAGLGLLAFIICLIGAFRIKKRLDEDEGHDLGYRRIKGEWIDTKGQVVDEEEDGTRHFRRTALLIAGVAALTMIVIFVLTQDIGQPMSMFDDWSTFFIILLVATVVAAVLVRKRLHVADDIETQQAQAAREAQVSAV